MSPYKGADRAIKIAKEAGENLIIAGMDENVESRDYVFNVPTTSYLDGQRAASPGQAGISRIPSSGA